ncbi:MAG TPA: ATP-binding protein, partial [Acidobacteriota bacterium]|nr:ATP-binding protein [Acidobacteriota bacterium]
DELPEDKIGKPETIKGSVSYIANELLENAMKYNEESAKFPVSISLYLYDEKLVFLVSNYTDQASGQIYSDYVKKLLTSDIDELYGQHLERIATNDGVSQMGLLTILNDYGATLGLKVDPVEASDLYRVTTMVLLPV